MHIVYGIIICTVYSVLVFLHLAVVRPQEFYLYILLDQYIVDISYCRLQSFWELNVILALAPPSNKINFPGV